MKRLGGIHVPHRKNTAGSVPKRIAVPREVTIPMSMHIGAPAKPVVKPGDEVKVGQLIGEAAGFVSSPVHASVSGRVKRIDEIAAFNGQLMTAVTIESDGSQTLCEALRPPAVTNLQEFLAAVRESGVVGLGGAGFPTAVKLTLKDPGQLETIIVNGAECEPYITSDTRAMLDDRDDIWEGVQLLRKYLGGAQTVIAIERNKPQCIREYQALASGAEGIRVQALPPLYPQGGEKVLIHAVTGRIVPEGKLPIDVGAVVINCTTLAAIVKYIKTGMPLVEKCITVDGSAVSEPQNVIAPIGTPVRELFAFCGGFKAEPKKILYGGPMMGIAVPDADVPVLKMTNAVLAFAEKDADVPRETNCIKCGRCVDRCPLRLSPVFIENAYALKRGDLLEKYKVNICMECGCCAYVCPANRPLVQVMKLSKAALREHQNQQKALEQKTGAKEAAK